MRTAIVMCALGVVLVLLSSAATAQSAEGSARDTDVELLRSNIQAGMKIIIQHTMQFTDAESKKFWPIYEDFALERQAVGDKLVQLIDDYAHHFDTMEDAKAKELTERMLNLEAENVNIRQNYWPSFAQALGAKRAAKFYQVDSRLSLLIKAQLMDEIPLVQ